MTPEQELQEIEIRAHDPKNRGCYTCIYYLRKNPENEWWVECKLVDDSFVPLIAGCKRYEKEISLFTRIQGLIKLVFQGRVL